MLLFFLVAESRVQGYGAIPENAPTQRAHAIE